MPTVTSTITRPDGSPADDARVVVELVGENSRRIAGSVAGVFIEGVHKPTVDEDGAWSVVVESNEDILPAGTVWKVSERVDGDTTVSLISVPDGAGPYDVADILTDEPGALPSGALAAEIVRATAAEAALDASVAQEVTDREDADAASNVVFYNGADPTGVADSRAAFVAADADASSETWVPPGTYKISSNLTLSKHVRFAKGAIIKPDNGVTVTFSDGITAGLYQVFDHSAGGVCVPKAVHRYHPHWWGATTGTTDQSTPWTRMLVAVAAAAVTVNGVDTCPPVAIPYGETRLFGVTLPEGCTAEGTLGSIIQPATAQTSGSMITVGGFGALRGTRLSSRTSTGITLIDTANANRAAIDDIYMEPVGVNVTGIHVGNGSGSRTNFLTNIWMLGNNSSGSLGIDWDASDVKAVNVWVGQMDTGVDFAFGGGRISNMHVWGCTTAGMTGQPDGTSFDNVFVENNGGWGCDFTNVDFAQFNSLLVWGNGAGIASTGGVRIRKSGSACRDNVFGPDCVFDDNVGTGLQIDGADRTDIYAHFTSRSVKGGGSPVSTRAIDIKSGSTKTRVRSAAAWADFTAAPVLDAGTNTEVDLGGFFQRLTSDSNPFNNSNVYASLFSGFSIAAGEIWEVEAFLYIEATGTSQGGDFKARINVPSGCAGYYGAYGELAGSATSTTAVSVNPANGQTATQTNNGLATGLVGLTATPVQQTMLFKGLVDNSAGAAGDVIMQGAQSTTDANATATVKAGSYFKATRRA